MVLKLYGSAMSTSRVLVTLLEKDLPYELIFVDIAKETKSLRATGSYNHLARKYASSGQNLIPEDDDESYGRFEQACSIEQSYFAAAAETIGTELMIKPMKGLGPPDEARVAQAEKDLDAVLAVYDQILARQRYLAGDELTLADLFHLPNAAALKSGRWKEVFARYPNTDRWLAELQERETWVKAAAEAATIP